MADRIIELLSNPETAGEMSSRGRETVRMHFNAERFVARMESLYDESLETER